MADPSGRLASIVTALEGVGLTTLVMGGHAVRFYGLNRDTNDFDLVLAPEGWDELPERLARAGVSPAGPPREGNTWRPGAFRRFEIGRLATGAEEWVEFWKHNHLLDSFEKLFSRRRVGLYGGREIAFLSLPDLIRSKETARNKDWDDIRVLEEIHDAELFASGSSDAAVLSQIRSRKGFDRFHEAGKFGDAPAVLASLSITSNPMTLCFLLPSAPDVAIRPSVPIESVVEGRLRATPFGSPLHMTLVELVRRRYKVVLQERDEADKRAIRAAQQPG